MKLIVNADDFGIDIDRDVGIAFGVYKGYVSSISVIVTNNINWLRIQMVKKMRKKVSVGIHINLTDEPLSQYTLDDLCVEKCDYPRKKHTFWHNALNGTVNISKVQAEMENQISKFIKLFGFAPDHIDVHNHCNIFSKEINDVFREASRKFDIHLRVPYEEFEMRDFMCLSKLGCYREDPLEDMLKMDLQNMSKEVLFKYDMLLYNYLCVSNNIQDEIPFMGTIYGYFRTAPVLLSHINRYNNNSTVQIMTHPGFYWCFVRHKSAFSCRDRYDELISLSRVYNHSNVAGFTYTTYRDVMVST